MFEATLVVMAAGMGRRFVGIKQIEHVGPHGQALLDFSVYDAKKAGFTKVVFIIKKQIEKDFKELVGKRIEPIIDVEYVFQETNDLPEGFTCPADREKPWGTGQAILCCKNTVTTPFAVINADDYYGATAFQQIFDQLKKATGNYCMVGFLLANTLTENGTVSRGVCQVENGKLQQIVERTKIRDCAYTLDGETWVDLPRDTVVSMNMWGFTTDIFQYLETGFVDFLTESLEVPKSEYLLPTVVANLMAAGKKEVDVLVAEDKWYGVTYKEDKESVVAALADKIAAGAYPGF